MTMIREEEFWYGNTMKGVFRVFMDKKNQRPEFHGSDLEKIAAYYHIPASEIPGIIKFGANVNPLGLSDKWQGHFKGKRFKYD